MTFATDIRGDCSYAGRPGTFLRVARLLDCAVVGTIALGLIAAAMFIGYALWNQMRVFEGTGLKRPENLEELAALKDVNPDIIGWLTVDGTSIDYPVLQGENDKTYFDRDVYGRYAVSGSIFLAEGYDPLLRDSYELIMGHHMEYGKMFGDLDKFLDRSFFDKNGRAELMVADRVLSLEAVAVLTADAYDPAIFGKPQAGEDRGAEMTAYLDEHALYRRKGAYSSSDQFIALMTCSSEATDARTVLVCKVVDNSLN